jgi:membrane protein implicated in regulation of membrane protease activity
LIKIRLEVAAAERGPWLHRIAIDLAASLGAAVAMLLALGAASLAAIEGLRLVLPGWLAALTVAVAWVGITALLLRVDHPRRLWRRLRRQTYGQTMATAYEDRSAAEADVRVTAERSCVKADGQMTRARPRRQGLARGLRSKCIRLTSTAITVTR